MRFIPSLVLAAGLLLGAAPMTASAMPISSGFVTTGPVIDFISEDDTQTLLVAPDGAGGIDLLFSAPISAFSFDAPFDTIDPLFVDFGLLTDPLEENGFDPDSDFLSITNAAGDALLFSDDALLIEFLDDPITPTFSVLFSELEGSLASSFGSFAVFTVGDLLDEASVPNPFQNATDDEEFEVFGLVQGAVVPLPAAGWMLLAGLGALAGLARTRRA